MTAGIAGASFAHQSLVANFSQSEECFSIAILTNSLPRSCAGLAEEFLDGGFNGTL
jgi:hypothetical protein